MFGRGSSLVLLTLLMALARDGRAEPFTLQKPGATGSFHLFSWNNDDLDVSLDQKAVVGGTKFKDSTGTVTMPLTPTITRTATYQTHAEVSYRSTNGTLGLSLDQTTTILKSSDPDFGRLNLFAPRSSVSVNMADQVNLSYTKEGDLPESLRDLAGKGLIYKPYVHGELSADFQGRSSATISVGASVAANRVGLFGYDLTDAGFSSISPSLSFTVPTTQSGKDFQSAEYGFGFSLKTNGGNSHAHFMDTMGLESITFVDGTTPESRGFSLTFASGTTSPNVAAVPEPGSLGLAGLGLSGLVGGRAWLRSRRRIRA